jgi:FtsP/CotA-like multicopper oxidase with cupredoxin domain
MSSMKFRVRFSTVVFLAAACFATAFVAPVGALVKDGNNGGPDGYRNKCRVAGSEANADASGFPQPEVRRSADGLLRTALHACVAKNSITDELSGKKRNIRTPTFEGSIPGPTLQVKPGDRLSILLANDLPSNPTNERAKAFPNDQYTLNLHTHGLTVSPLGISDNIFRPMDPGTAHQIEVKIPKDHPTGTFWYHTHKHGSVTYQFLGGMVGFLIIKGGRDTLDAVPEVAAAKDIVMGFQVIRTVLNGSLAFVNQKAQQFGTYPFGTTDITKQGLWSTYGLDGAPGRSFFYYTTNGVTNPTLHMRPGEVQRWRLLNASDGDNLLISLQDHRLNVVAMDGITVEKIYRLEPGDPLVLGPGQRMEVMVKASSKPGTYLLQTLDPTTANIAGVPCCSVSPFRDAKNPGGIAPEQRLSKHSFDFPVPCAAPSSADRQSGRRSALLVSAAAAADPCATNPPKKLGYPVTLATIVIDGPPLQMHLPVDPLPVPKGLPSVAKMLGTKPDAVRHVAFELCGDVKGTSQDPRLRPSTLLPSCGWYFAKYGAQYWGGAPFSPLMMMRDDDDKGEPNPGNPAMPRINFKKSGLFDPDTPLFSDMIAGNYEEWTVTNRSFSDHPFHIHQNHVLVTKINGIALPRPEWHDTLIVPSAVPQPAGPYEDHFCNGKHW